MKSALERIQDYIAKRDHSEKELRQKLAKYHKLEEIEVALSAAADAGWLADPQIIAERVAAALGRRGKGHHFIQGYLRRKGLPSSLRDPENEFEKAKRLLENKLRAGDSRDKALRLLRNRGYDLEVISKVLRGFAFETRIELKVKR